MGILESIKKTATDTLKTVATETVKKAVGANSNSTTEQVIAKAAALVGSKVAGAMSNTQAAPPQNSPAAAKAASLVGSKAPQTEQSYQSYNQSYEMSPAEVESIIEARVRAKGRPSNWKVSIVDLMSALDMNSSLSARAALAARLNYPGPHADGSAEKNMWLHAELLKVLAKNRGEIPWELKDATSAGSSAAPNVTQYAAPNSYASVNGLTPEVEANIEARVRAKGRPSNWRVSIVDLMSALDMNSSLSARKVLAAKLNYSGPHADGSAEKNMWLHAELLRILAQNRCEIPWDLKDPSAAVSSTVPNPAPNPYPVVNGLTPAVEANIEARVRAKGIYSNWRVSLVDLMIVLDMDSSLAGRQRLAAMLDYPGYSPDGSTEKDMWLHAELLSVLAQNGCEVPFYLL
jgi:hypothetical protein